MVKSDVWRHDSVLYEKIAHQGLSTDYHLTSTLKMASAQVVETSVVDNSPSQDSNHPDDLFQSRYVTPGLKPFSYLKYVMVAYL